MKKVILALALFAALAFVGSASALSVAHAQVKLSTGANCSASTSPPCQILASWTGYLAGPYSAYNSSIFGCSSDTGGMGCQVFPDGHLFYGQVTSNICTCNPTIANRVGNLTLKERQACPTGGGFKYSPAKTFFVDWNVTPWSWFGDLQITDTSGCQPS